MNCQKTKKKNIEFSIENLIYLFIILCPILDSISFIFRKVFHTFFSPSTVVRAGIPIFIMIYLFFKAQSKSKIKLIAIGSIYLLYSIIHILLYKQTLNSYSYGGIKLELQYIINYTFLIINLIIFLIVFSKNNDERIKKNLAKSVLLSNTIYIIILIISISTGTSSSTYIEGIGQKGWFESGNSIGSIMITSLFIISTLLKDRKYKYFVTLETIAEGIFLTMVLGTRVGLLGFTFGILAIASIKCIFKIINRKKISKNEIKVSEDLSEKVKQDKKGDKSKVLKNILTIGLIIILILVLSNIIIYFVSKSNAIKRREYLKNIEENIYDKSNKEEAHITGDLLKIKEKIEAGKIDNTQMSKEEKEAIIELYNSCNKMKVRNNDRRIQQLIYNISLVNKQKNINYILFGNGFTSKFYELILEMEIPAFLLNFGIIGFVLYFIPFFSILLYGIYLGIKRKEYIDEEYIILIIGLGFVFVLSFFAGYTFFNSSNMIIIATISTMIVNKIHNIKLNTMREEK